MEVAILYSSSQNSLRKMINNKCNKWRPKCRNPLFIKSEFSQPAWTNPGGIREKLKVAILYSSSQNSLIGRVVFLEGISLLVLSQSFIHQVRILSLQKNMGNYILSLIQKSQSFIHQVRILSAPPQPLALHGLKYSFPQTSVFQL